MHKKLQTKIIPGLLEADINIIKKYTKILAPYFETKKINKIQFDICDGVYVKSLSYGKTQKEFKNLVTISNKLTDLYGVNVQLDMMTKMKAFTKDDKSETALDNFISNVSDLHIGDIIIHYDSMDKDEWDYLLESINYTNKTNKNKINIIPAFVYKNFSKDNSEGVIDFLKKYTEKNDTGFVIKNIQIMGIKTIGKQGQKFVTDILDIVKNIKSIYPKLKIQIDGGCNISNIENIISDGADSVVFGSQIFKGDIKANLRDIFV